MWKGATLLGLHWISRITNCWIYRGRASYRFLCVALQMLRNMKGQFAEHLLAAGFVSSRNPRDSKSNINSGNRRREIVQWVHFNSPFVNSVSLGRVIFHRQWEVTQSCYMCWVISKGCKDSSKLQQKKENVRLSPILFLALFFFKKYVHLLDTNLGDRSTGGRWSCTEPIIQEYFAFKMVQVYCMGQSG